MEMLPQPGGARALLNASLSAGAVGLAWLGQAGFAVRAGDRRLLIDPYLSDHLARKYAGKEFSHIRLMPPPVDASALRDLDFVLCSHRHGDHMDPDSLPILARNNPRCRFVVPRAEREHAQSIGLDESRLIPVNDGDSAGLAGTMLLQSPDGSPHPDPLPSQARGEGNLSPSRLCAPGRLPVLHAKNLSLSPRQRGEGRGEGPRQLNCSGLDELEIRVIASAHETLQTNARGEHYFLGFIVRAGALTIYHAGDCVVYEGLAQRLREERVDVALLPVNGRSASLTVRGVPGNMSFAEARDLCAAAGVGLLVPHHFGMFAFNTADPAKLRRQIAETNVPRCVLPEEDKYYKVVTGQGS